MRKVYLDHNATTPVHPDVLEAMLPFLGESFGNPSSHHWAGRAVVSHIEEARALVARLIGARPEEIVFTGSGSEGDNMAIKGVLQMAGRNTHCITSEVEHPAVYKTCAQMEELGYEITFLPVDEHGIVSPADVRKALRPETALVSIMLANNETGSINPIAEIAEDVRRHGALMHADAVQGVGKIPVNVDAMGVDMLTASAHKFNGPKGVGFQYVREGIEAFSLVTGGSQERGLRAGTENVSGIVGLGAACKLSIKKMRERIDRIGAMRKRLEDGVLGAVPRAKLNGHPDRRVYNTLSVSFPGIEGEALMSMLDHAGIAVSTGSACASDSSKPSRVLGAMGLDSICARGTLRMSLGYGITDEDIDYVLEMLPPMANRLFQMSPVD